MRLAVMVALAATVAGCATAPVNYQASLSQQDERWESPECLQARLQASAYETREKNNPGWATGVILGPYGLGMVAAIKENEQKQRRRVAREVHLQCSSLPLPDELQEEPAQDAGM